MVLFIIFSDGLQATLELIEKFYFISLNSLTEFEIIMIPILSLLAEILWLTLLHYSK